MPRKISVVQPKNKDEEIPLEVMAASVVKLAEVGKQLSASRLKQKTVIMLLHDATGVGKREIEAILDALPELEKRYLK